MITMYSTTWCGYCHRLKSQMDREGLSYTVVDIEQDQAAAEFVMGVNGGNQTVPTLRFADGSALTNPTIIQVKEKLASLATPQQRQSTEPLGGVEPHHLDALPS